MIIHLHMYGCAPRQFSKIGKVMRLVAALAPEAVPRDDEFRFRARAQAMLGRWLALLTYTPHVDRLNAKIAAFAQHVLDREARAAKTRQLS